jgi:hypothetical protein
MDFEPFGVNRLEKQALINLPKRINISKIHKIQLKQILYPVTNGSQFAPVAFYSLVSSRLLVQTASLCKFQGGFCITT